MAKVNIGTAADDGTGDPLRTAFGKINDEISKLVLIDDPAAGKFNLVGNQIVPPDHATALASKELITIGNVARLVGDIGTHIDTKVDKVTGMSLTHNDYTDAEKAKLAGLEGSHFKGAFTDEAALLLAHPTAEAGSYAYVGVHHQEHVYVWDGTQWDDTGTAGSAHLTDAQIKTQYENNPDTEVLTTVEKSLIASALQTHQDITGKVDVVTGKTLTDLPLAPTADGDYTLDIASGIATWAADSGLKTRGVIHNVAEILTQGIYEGMDIVGAPQQGKAIIVAFQDTAGDMALEFYDQTSHVTFGGRASGGIVTWETRNPDHLHGTTDPDNTLGLDGDLYFKYV